MSNLRSKGDYFHSVGHSSFQESLEKCTRSNFVHRFSWYYLEFLLLPSTFYGCLAGHLCTVVYHCMVVHLSRAERAQFITKITVFYLDMLKSSAVVASKEIEGH